MKGERVGCRRPRQRWVCGQEHPMLVRSAAGRPQARFVWVRFHCVDHSRARVWAQCLLERVAHPNGTTGRSAAACGPLRAAPEERSVVDIAHDP